MRYRADAEVLAVGRAGDLEAAPEGLAGRGDDRAEGQAEGQAAETADRAGTEVCAFSDGEVSADVFCKTACPGKYGRKNQSLQIHPA